MPLSATGAVSAALEQTEQQLFRPWRPRFWARMAVVAMTTGEFSSPGSYNEWGHWLPTSQPRRLNVPWRETAKAIWERMLHFWPLLVVLAILTVVLAAMWIYMACVFRFILFESVLDGECDVKAGWPKWKPQGLSYLLWKVVLWLSTAVVTFALVGAPWAWAIHDGLLQQGGEHLSLGTRGGAASLVFMALFLLTVGIASLLAQDFVVPIMALEKVGILEGWRRFYPMLRQEKKSYAGYLLMRVLLSLGVAFVFGIASLLALLLMMIPLAILGLGIFLAGKAAHLAFNYYTFSAVVILAGGALAAIVYVLSLVSTPAMIFFQSYANHFLGSRYPALGARVFPGAAPAPSSES